MSVPAIQSDLQLNRSFEIAGANKAMRFMRGEMEPLQISGLGAYLNSMTPGLWQSIGPSIEAIMPLLTKGEEPEGFGFDDYEVV